MIIDLLTASDISYYGWCLCRPASVFFCTVHFFVSFPQYCRTRVVDVTLNLYCTLFCSVFVASGFTYNRQPASMIPGFSGLPVMYRFLFRWFVLQNKYDDDDDDDDELALQLRRIWFLGPNRVYTTNGTSSGSAIFAGFTVVPNRPAYGQTTLVQSV